MAGYPASTSTVQVCVSGVIQSNIEEAWSAVKAWGDAAWMGPAVLLEGSEQTIGALRRVSWGRGRVVERLTGYDVNSHTQKSRLISHHENVNPFPASFLNYVTALKLTEVTIDASTFVELQGSFETDQLEADAMHDSVNASYEARIRGLQALLCASAPEAPAAHCALEAHVQRGALASTHSCGWHSTGSVASVASGTIAEQQAIAAAMQAAAATAAAAEALAEQRSAFAQQAAQLETQRRALEAQAAAQAEREAEAAAAAAHAQQQQQHAALAAAYGDASPTASQAYCAAQQQAAAAFAAMAVSQAPGAAAAAAQTYEYLAATQAAQQAALLALASSQAMMERPGAYAALSTSSALNANAAAHVYAAPTYAAPAAPASPGPVKPAQAAQPPSPAGPGFAPGLPGGFVPGRPEPSNDSSGGASISPRKARSEHGRAS